MRVYFKTLMWWLLSITVTFVVLLHLSRDPEEPRADASEDRKQRSNEQDLMSKAERLVKTNVRKTKLDKILKTDTDQNLENLQFFPKLDQTKLLNAALVNRPELKNFLKERFDLLDKKAKIGPKEPQLMTKGGDKKVALDRIDKEKLKRHKVKFVLNVSNKCSVDKPFVLFFVHSSWDNKGQRQLIRQTWAQVTTYKGHVIRLIFVLAEPNSTLNKASKTKAASDIATERKTYDDIIQGDFIDHYRNLTKKHLLVYHWILKHCPKTKYVIKVDDDVAVNIFRVINFLDSSKNPLRDNTNLIYCSAFVKQGPRRDKKDKWYVTKKEYPKDKYPTYCEGLAYITTPEVVLRLYNASLAQNQYWIDDVYITGILAEAAHVKHKQFRDPNGYKTLQEDVHEKYTEVVNHALFVLVKYKMAASEWLELWKTVTLPYQTKDYSVNNRYKNIKFHLPHHTL